MSTVSEPAGRASEADAHRTPHRGLDGHMGVLELIFTVVAYNGPVVVFLGFLPALILLGNGIGAPSTILAAGALIALVAFGLITMAGRLDKPGGFYALITAGLGVSLASRPASPRSPAISWRSSAPTPSGASVSTG